MERSSTLSRVIVARNVLWQATWLTCSPAKPASRLSLKSPGGTLGYLYPDFSRGCAETKANGGMIAELAPAMENDWRVGSPHWGIMAIIHDIEATVRQIDELCKAVLDHPSQMANRERLFSELAAHTTSLSDHASLLQVVPLLGLVGRIVAQTDVVERRIAHSWARAPDDPNAVSAIDCAARDLLSDLSVLRDMLTRGVGRYNSAP